MTHPTLGYDPAPGEPAAVRQIAITLGTVSDDAERITSRLQRISRGAGDAVWRGAAADSFHELLTDVGPAVVRLTNAHREAHDALLHYADTLERAQDTAWRAESDAARATTERDEQSRTRQRAADEAAQLDRQVWECRRQIAQSQATRLLWAADPAYQAELVRYETQTRGVQHRAESLAAETRGRENTARGAESAAAARIEAARVLGAQAKELRDTAARRTVERLDTAGRQGQVHGGLVRRFLNSVDDIGRSIVTSPTFEHFMTVLGVVSTAVAIVGFAILLAGAAVPGAILFAGAALGIGTVLAVAAGLRYGTRNRGDLVEAILGAVPLFGKGVALGGRVVTRMLPAAKPVIGRAVSGIGGIRPVREIVRFPGTVRKQIPALRHFTGGDLYDLGYTTISLTMNPKPLIRLLPLLTPVPLLPLAPFVIAAVSR